MAHDAECLIVGGGLNGTLLALALAQGGLSSVIVDALPEPERALPDFDGRSYAVAHASCRLLQNLGLWADLKHSAQPILDIKVSDGRAGEGPGPFFMHFDHAEIEEGPMGHMIEDRHLRPVLLEAVRNTSLIQSLSGQSVVAQEETPAGVAITLTQGETLSGRLLIGADGRNSPTAQRAGIARTGWGYSQTALVCAIAHEKPHNGVAHQFFMPTGPLAILPLCENRSSIVWSETAENAAAFMDLSDADFLTMLRPRFGDFLGQISLEGKRYSYPLALSLAQHMIAPRVALVGDAAHGIHPIAGQGLNAGFRDIAALAACLGEAARRGEDIGSPGVLSRFESWRRFDNTTLSIATDTFNRLFSNDNALLRIGRDLGIGLVNRVPALRRGFIREAAGLTGDLPPLMQ